MAHIIALLVFASVIAAPAYAKDYTVGDSSGWTSGVDYNTWASTETFHVGDTLVFQYAAIHNVDEVSESDYKACSSGNSLQSHNDQNTKITLSKPGTRYFICGTPGHCSGGMKLAVTVAAAAPAPAPTPATPATTPKSTPKSTPEAATPTASSEVPATPKAPTATKSSTSTSGASEIGLYSNGKAVILGLMVVLGAVFMV